MSWSAPARRSRRCSCGQPLEHKRILPRKAECSIVEDAPRLRHARREQLYALEPLLQRRVFVLRIINAWGAVQPEVDNLVQRATGQHIDVRTRRVGGDASDAAFIQ